MKLCPTCGKQVKRKAGAGRPSKFCSEKCRRARDHADLAAKRGSASVPKKKDAVAEVAKTFKITSPGEWGALVFKKYNLSEHEVHLVLNAVACLTIIRDPEEEWRFKNQAMGRFSAILYQLKLEEREAEEEHVVETTSEPVVRGSRPNVDPRKQLRVVS